MEISHLKFLANFKYEQWAMDIYNHYSFNGKFNTLVSLLDNPRATIIIKKSLLEQYPEQPEWVLELVARENLKELKRIFRQYEFAVAN